MINTLICPTSVQISLLLHSFITYKIRRLFIFFYFGFKLKAKVGVDINTKEIPRYSSNLFSFFPHVWCVVYFHTFRSEFQSIFFYLTFHLAVSLDISVAVYTHEN